MAALTVGLIPSHLSFYQEDSGMAKTDQMKDSLAMLVIERFRAAVTEKRNYRPYQNRSVIELLDIADRAMEKRYTDEQADVLTAAMGIACPKRFYGLAATKTTEIANWKTELVAGDPGSLLQIVPTPSPRLPEASIMKIKREVKIDLMRKLADAGIGDPTILMGKGNGRLHPLVKEFLTDKALLLRGVEQTRLVSAAKAAASKVQVKFRDLVIEGDFREAYARFSHNQVRHGIGIIRFPLWRRRVVLSDNQDMKGKLKREMRTVPTFHCVSAWNFFPTNDGDTLDDNTALMEHRTISKVQLIQLASDRRYDRKQIMAILEENEYSTRSWLFPDASDTEESNGEDANYWGPDAPAALLIHEGLVTGRDLQEYGATGYDEDKVYDARLEVCCGRTIRVDVKDPASEAGRSYAAAKFDDLGPGVWNAVGVPAILHDTEQRVNTIFHAWENNLDWALRPPLLRNTEGLRNPNAHIAPGTQHDVTDLMGPGQTPDPLRTIKGPSAQYQIVWPLLLQIIRQADHEVGVPSLSDMSSFGKGSLGELSARVSQAVRRVRSAAYTEDRSLRPIWRNLYEHVLDENPELVENVDLDMDYRGILGVLQAEQARQSKMTVLGVAQQGLQMQAVPKQVVDYAYRDVLDSLGVPTTELGMGDPLLDNAMAAALEAGPPTAGTGLNLVPQLDGRSGSISGIPSAVAAPNGAPSGAPAGP
jgi:hypothetical protein